MYYDAIQFGEGDSMQLPVRSLVGLIPLYATLVLEPSVIQRFPGFSKRMQWFIDNRPEISQRNMANMKGTNAATSCEELPVDGFQQLRVRASGDCWLSQIRTAL